MNLLAKREHDVPMELERVFPGVEDFFRSFFGPLYPPGTARHHFGGVHDIKVEEKDVKLQIACPGHAAEDFDLEINGDLLTVKTCCECENKHNTADGSYLFRERSCMNFEETLHLPVRVLADGAKAEYRHGVLHVTIPRDIPEKPAPRIIKVKCSK